jgi:hypothetical protein
MSRTNSRKKRDKRKVDPSVHRGEWGMKPVHLTTPKKIEYQEKQNKINKQKGWNNND